MPDFDLGQLIVLAVMIIFAYVIFRGVRNCLAGHGGAFCQVWHKIF